MSDEATRGGHVRSTPEGGPLDAGQKADTAEPSQHEAPSEAAPRPSTSVIEALDVVVQALTMMRMVDEANALINREDVKYRPLTTALGKALETLQKAVQPAPAPSPAEKPASPRKSRGRPRKDGSAAQARSPEERAVKEIYDDDEGEWVRAGRGRIPKGVRSRLVDPKTGDVLDDNSDD